MGCYFNRYNLSPLLILLNIGRRVVSEIVRLLVAISAKRYNRDSFCGSPHGDIALLRAAFSQRNQERSYCVLMVLVVATVSSSVK